MRDARCKVATWPAAVWRHVQPETPVLHWTYSHLDPPTQRRWNCSGVATPLFCFTTLRIISKIQNDCLLLWEALLLHLNKPRTRTVSFFFAFVIKRQTEWLRHIRIYGIQVFAQILPCKGCGLYFSSAEEEAILVKLFSTNYMLSFFLILLAPISPFAFSRWNSAKCKFLQFLNWS